MIDLDLFSDISNDVAMATNFVKKWQTPHFHRSTFRNGMRYRYLSVRINSENDASILCKNFVNFDVVTPDSRVDRAMHFWTPGTTRPKNWSI